MIIFMNHLTSFVHSLEHKDDAYIFSSKITKFSEDSDSTKTCFYCQTYLKLDYTQQESIVYSLMSPLEISVRISDTEKQLLSFIPLRKKSRSPPTYNI